MSEIEIKDAETQVLATIRAMSIPMASKFVALGAELVKAETFCKDVFNLDKGRPCKNIYEWAEYRLSYKKTTTATIIGVCKRFCDTDNSGCMSIKPNFKSYSFSQLVEVLSVPDELLSFISPEMTVKQIRLFKKEKTVQTSEQKYKSEENKGIERFVVFKNDNERLDYLNKYDHWGLWFNEPRLNVNYYRTMLSNGDYIIASVPCPYSTNEYGAYETIKPSPVFKIITAGSNKARARYDYFFSHQFEVVRFIKTNRLKVIYDFWGDKKREEKEHQLAFERQNKLDAKEKARRARKAQKAIEKEMNCIKCMNGGIINEK